MTQIDIHVVALIVIALGTAANSTILLFVKIGINKFSDEMAGLWKAVDALRTNQMILKEALPKEYLRLEGPGYKAIMDSLQRIEAHSEQVANELYMRQKFEDHK